MRKSFRLKTIMIVFLPVVAVCTALMIFTVMRMQHLTTANVEQRMTQLARSGALRFDIRLREVAQIARMTASLIEDNPQLTSEEIYGQLQRNLELCPLIFGSAVCFEPYKYNPNQRLFVRYVFRDGDVLRRTDPSTTGYNYTEEKQEYWHTPRNTGKALWTEPYYDKGAGNILMATYSVPFFRDGKFLGIATIDIPLELLRELVNLEMPEGFDFSVITKRGVCVYSPVHTWINKSVARIFEQRDREDLVALARAIASGATGKEKLSGWTCKDPRWIFHAPVESAQWGFAASVHEETALLPVRNQLHRGVAILLGTLVLIAGGLWFITLQISRPITRLNTAVSELAKGNLNATTEWASNDEIGMLVRSFNELTLKLSEREEALRKSGERLKQLADASWEAIVIHDDGIILEANEQYFEMFGYKREELIGQEGISRTTTPESLEAIRQQIAGGHMGPYPATGKRKDGTEFSIEIRVRKLDYDGREVRVAAIRDQTDIERANQQLYGSEERYRAIAEDMPVLICRFLPSTEITYVNQAYCRCFDRTPEALVGSSFLPLIPDEQRETVMAGISALTVESPLQSHEHKVLAPDGDTRWQRWTNRALFDDQGEVVAYQSIGEDITERKQAEKKLTAATTFLDTIVDMSPFAMWIADPKGTVIRANRSLYKILNLTEEQLVGKYNVFADENLNTHGLMSKVKNVFTKFEPVRFVMPWKAGEAGEVDFEGSGDRFIDASLFPILNAEGELTHVVCQWVDITDHKRAEEERLSLERQLQHGQKLESLGILAGGIAHDFNNLLMAILGNADLALGQLDPHAPARKNIQEIEKASKRAADIAKQMLAYSGKGQFVIEPIDLNALVEEMAHLLVVSISKKAVLSYNFADNLPVFHGDPTQIRQIIMNLIVNASEAIEETNGVIALSTGVMDCDNTFLQNLCVDQDLEAGLYVYLEVADTGCGMDLETIDKVFDPFFTTKFTGRGLGMSAVMGIVRGHKGAIKAYSEVDKGTTFKVFFPVTQSVGDGLPAQGSVKADRKAWRGEGTILIADDEETVCTVGKQMLERLGFNVLTAPDGREAVNVFRAHADEIACVLLDLTMPHLDGKEAFREIRRIRSKTRVVLCSGYNMQDATLPFAGQGLAGFIQKPFTMATLREKLCEVLSATEKGE